MNVYIVTAGQCGSRVVAEAMMNLGFEAPGANPENLDTVYLGRLEQRFLADRDLIRASLNFCGQFDNAVFKSLALMRSINNLDGQIIGVYRHPGAWKIAHKKRVQLRKNEDGGPRKVEKPFIWWCDYHRYLLMYAKEMNFPLIDFSMDFEEDMTRHFGDCLSHYDPSRINEKPDDSICPNHVMELYRELTECRKSQEPIIRIPSISGMSNAGTN